MPKPRERLIQSIATKIKRNGTANGSAGSQISSEDPDAGAHEAKARAQRLGERLGRIEAETMQRCAAICEEVALDPRTSHHATECAQRIHALAKRRSLSPRSDDRLFIRGVVYACAELVRGHDQPSMATDILRAAGVGLKDAIAAECDDFDLRMLRLPFADVDPQKAHTR